MDPIDKPGIGSFLKSSDSKDVRREAQSYLTFFKGEKSEADLGKYRESNSVQMTNYFYDLVTVFYEYGWGESFHFAARCKAESREHCLAKQEYRLALKLAIKPQDAVLDMGCGIGGPARHIAIFSDAKITGLNVNDYQLNRARQLTKKAGLQDRCTFVKGNFLNAPFSSGTFDKIYAIEATCHAPRLAQVYAEAYRILKPGGLFAAYEWIMTDKYDPSSSYHKKIKHDIMEGNALPDLHTKAVVLDSLREVGFEVLESEDLALKSEVPWQSELTARWTFSEFRMTPAGLAVTHAIVSTLETLHLAPEGSSLVHDTLRKAAEALVKGGDEGIFTPMFMFVVRKPLLTSQT